VAYIFNPKLTVIELLQTVCEEFSRARHHPRRPGAHAEKPTSTHSTHSYCKATPGRNCVLIIDEAQNLQADVLEQLRLLTNLETSARKLLQIVLIGQPELRTMLDRPELEQLAQRVIARFHLDALTEGESLPSTLPTAWQ
jgi:general secretion pathway protein A